MLVTKQTAKKKKQHAIKCETVYEHGLVTGTKGGRDCLGVHTRCGHTAKWHFYALYGREREKHTRSVKMLDCHMTAKPFRQAFLFHKILLFLYCMSASAAKQYLDAWKYYGFAEACVYSCVHYAGIWIWCRHWHSVVVSSAIAGNRYNE